MQHETIRDTRNCFCEEFFYEHLNNEMGDSNHEPLDGAVTRLVVLSPVLRGLVMTYNGKKVATTGLKNHMPKVSGPQPTVIVLRFY